MGKTDNPNYCLYYRMLGHPTKSCYFFKDIIQTLIDAEVLKLRLEQKKVMANMTLFLQFGVQLLTQAGVVPIPKRELRVVNTDPHHQQEKDLIHVSTLKERLYGFILTSWKASSGLLLPAGSPGGKQKLHLAM